MNFWFDLKVVPQEKLPYVAILTELLGKLDAGKYSYEQLDKALNINTGGFNTSVVAYLPEHKDSKLLPRIKLQIKTTPEKLDTAFDLLENMVNSTKFDNIERISEMIKRHQSQIEASVNQNGFSVAATRLESYYSQRGMFAEKIRGLDYYWFITDLSKRFNSEPEPILNNLKEVYNLLFSKQNLIAGTTCDEKDFKTYADKFATFAGKLNNKPSTQLVGTFEPKAMNEGMLTTSKVQYALQGFDFETCGLAWNGKWHVLNQIMSTDWLQTRIRVMGGAYGGFSRINKNGTVYLASYRDPNLSETLDNFKGTVAYLEKFEADSAAMTRYIIGTIANLDYPLTPSEKGEQAFRWYFEGVSKDEIQTDRDAVLATNAKDIQKMSVDMSRIIDKHVFCVYGNDAKIMANKSLFNNLVKLQK
jgi:Zn-dependent M16 (insulinase) family peptidase